MTVVQRTSQVVGFGFVAIAIWGYFISGGAASADPATAPRILGLFPVNHVHNTVHLAFGLWGAWAARSHAGAKTYAIVAGTLYVILAGLGFLTPDLGGLMPIGGHDIWLHALIGITLATVGFAAPGASAVLDEPHVEPDREPAPEPETLAETRNAITASSPEGAVTRPPAQPSGTSQHRKPVRPEPAHNEGAAPAAPPPSPPENVVDEPPRRPEE